MAASMRSGRFAPAAVGCPRCLRPRTHPCVRTEGRAEWRATAIVRGSSSHGPHPCDRTRTAQSLGSRQPISLLAYSPRWRRSPAACRRDRPSGVQGRKIDPQAFRPCGLLQELFRSSARWSRGLVRRFPAEVRLCGRTRGMLLGMPKIIETSKKGLLNKQYIGHIDKSRLCWVGLESSSLLPDVHQKHVSQSLSRPPLLQRKMI